MNRTRHKVNLLSGSTVGLNSEFFFSEIGCLIKVKKKTKHEVYLIVHP